MGELRVSLPEELKETREGFPGVDWGVVIRRTLKGELEEICELKSIVAKSKLTQEDAVELGRKVNGGMYREYKKRLEGLNESG